MADITVTAASVVATGSNVGIPGTAGEAITAGETIYRDATTSKWFKADGNDVAKMPSISAGESLGLALNGAALNQPVRVLNTPNVTVAIGTHGVALGTPVFQSATGGKMCPFADLASGNLTTCTAIITSTTEFLWGPTGGTIAIP